MLPLCKKMETSRPKNSGIDQSLHGHNGPIHISDGGFRGNSGGASLDSIKNMGHKEIADLQD